MHTAQPGTTLKAELERLLNEYQYAEIRGCSVATVRRDRLLRRGCPWVKIGSLVRYRPSDITSFINDNVRLTGVQ